MTSVKDWAGVMISAQTLTGRVLVSANPADLSHVGLESSTEFLVSFFKNTLTLRSCLDGYMQKTLAAKYRSWGFCLFRMFTHTDE